MKRTYLDQSIDDEPRVKVLLDADVLLELFVNRSGFVEDLERLLAEIETSRQVEVYITDKCLKRIRIEDELGDEASSFVEEMVRGRVIKIDSDIRALARVSCLQDYDSAEELACANAKNLDAIITQNPQNFDGSTLPIWSVADLLNRVSLEKSLEKPCEDQDLQQGLFAGSFNIIHFTGHGTSDDIDVSNIRKIMGHGTSDDIDLSNIRKILEAPRLIFLNACSSGTTKTFRNRRKDCIADSFTTTIDLESLKVEISGDPTDAHTISTEPENQAEKWAKLLQAYLKALKLSEESEINTSLNSDSHQQPERSG